MPLLVHDHALDCSVADRPDNRNTRSRLDPATSPHVQGPGHYHEIAGFDEFVGLDPNGLKVLGEILQGVVLPDQG